MAVGLKSAIGILIACPNMSPVVKGIENRVLGDVLHRLPAKILPSIKPPQLLADRFVEFFTEKIEKIRSTFSASANLQHITLDSPPPMFSTFSTVTED